MNYIGEDRVRELITWENTFEATEAALKSVSEQKAVQNPRTFTKVLNGGTVLLSMPGYLENNKFGALGCKLVTGNKNNGKITPPLPTINANIMLFDENTGIMTAVVAGTEITTRRTAAASAVATKYVHANKPKKVMAVLGAGNQGQAHAESFYHYFKFEEIRIWNHHPEKAQKLVEELNKTVADGVFKFFEDNEKCVKNADVIATCTNATSPIVKYDWVKPGVHINSVGAGLVHYSELEEKLYKNCDLYIDHEEGAKKELHGLLEMGVPFKAEIGELIVHQGQSRSSPERITVFQSLGMAVEDCAMAKMICNQDKNQLCYKM